MRAAGFGVRASQIYDRDDRGRTRSDLDLDLTTLIDGRRPPPGTGGVLTW